MRHTLSLLAGASLALAGCSARSGVAVEPRIAVVEVQTSDPDSNRVWVCHRGRWQEVAAPAAGAGQLLT